MLRTFREDCKAAGAKLSSLLPFVTSKVSAAGGSRSTVGNPATAAAAAARPMKEIKIPTFSKAAQPLELRDLWSFLKEQFEFMSTMSDVEKYCTVIYDIESMCEHS